MERDRISPCDGSKTARASRGEYRETQMRGINRRLGRLENKLGVVETEFTRQLAVCIKAGRRRAAEARSAEDCPECTREVLCGLSVAEILLRGRQRARQATIEAQ